MRQRPWRPRAVPRVPWPRRANGPLAPCGRALAWCATLAWCAPLAAAEHYTIDPAHSMPVFAFRHLGASTQTGRFGRVHGSITLDLPARRGSVDYVIESASLDLVSGSGGASSEGLRLLEAGLFPSIRFRAHDLRFAADGRLVGARGTLELLGLSRPLVVRVRHFRCGAHPLDRRWLCAADVSASLKRSDFGMVDDMPVVSDEIRVSVPIEAYRD